MSLIDASGISRSVLWFVGSYTVDTFATPEITYEFVPAMSAFVVCAERVAFRPIEARTRRYRSLIKSLMRVRASVDVSPPRRLITRS